MDSGVYIVEDEAIIAQSERVFLEKQGFSVAGIAGSAREFLEAFPNNPAAQVIMDISMEYPTAGIDAAREIGISFPSVRIHFLSSFPKSHFEAQLSGVRYESYLDKTRFRSEIGAVLSRRRDCGSLSP